MNSKESAFLIYCRLNNMDLIDDKDLKLEKLKACSEAALDLFLQISNEVDVCSAEKKS